MNILIIDDNWYVGDQIKNRLQSLDMRNNTKEMNVEYISGSVNQYFSHYNEPNFIDKIADKLLNTDYLLLDLHFQDLNIEESEKITNEFVLINIDDKAEGIEFKGLTDAAKKYLQTYSVKSVELFKQIDQSKLNKINQKLKGLILYTYSPNPKQGELAGKAKLIRKALNLNKERIEIFSSHKEIYQSAGAELYKTDRVSKNLVSLGYKSDFRLYGTAMGEIIYHKIIDKENAKSQKRLKSKRARLWLRIPLFFFILLCIDLGSNTISEMIKVSGANNKLILSICLFLGIILPLLILLLKPEILIDYETDKSNES